MFELSDYLTGIYKITDYTRSLTIRNRQDNEDINVQMVPDTQNPDYQPTTQSIFEELRRKNVDDTQLLDSQFQNTIIDPTCLDSTLLELTGSQMVNTVVSPPEPEVDQPVDNVEPSQSPNVSILMDIES